MHKINTLVLLITVTINWLTHKGYAHVERWEVSALIACIGQRLFPALVSAYGGHVESWRPALVY
jgi:hypothetical protein